MLISGIDLFLVVLTLAWVCLGLMGQRNEVLQKAEYLKRQNNKLTADLLRRDSQYSDLLRQRAGLIKRLRIELERRGSLT